MANRAQIALYKVEEASESLFDIAYSGEGSLPSMKNGLAKLTKRAMVLVQASPGQGMTTVAVVSILTHGSEAVDASTAHG